MSDFVHLHVHTQYSLLDGMNKPYELFQKVKDQGMDSVAITDHGVLYGVPEFWKASKDFGVKPIIGCEMYLAPTQMGLKQEVDGIRYYHLLLICKNKVGYQNLIKLVTQSHLNGMYYKPRIDLELLKKHTEGLICTSACLAGPLSRHIVKDEYEKAEWWLKQLHGLFKDDFYLEIQRNGLRCEDEIEQDTVNKLPKNELEDQLNMLKQQIKVNKKLYEYSDQYKIPVIASTDAHYLNKEDKDIQKILFCIRDGRKIDDPKGLNGYIDTYIKSPEEMKEIFSDMPEVLTETLKISEKIEEFSIKPDRVQPKYWNLPKNSTSKEELEKQTFEGAYKKYVLTQNTQDSKSEVPKDLDTIRKALPENVLKQVEYELMVIDKMGYNDYFLVVGDLMQFARNKEIVVGVRGSAAGCLVSYCLGITNVDPLTWSLVFERFLNLERASPPDIDMDIQDDRREELIDYAREKYGQTSVAGIITFGRMATKAAIRDVARVMGIDLAVADKLSKKVIVLFGKPFSFEKMMGEDPEFKQMVDADPELQRLGEAVKKIENLNRHTGVHAAGYLITPGPIDNYMAFQKDSKDEKLLVTQMDGTWIDKLDYMKFDFLGLRTLTILKNAILYVKERHGIKIDLSTINVHPDEPEDEYDKRAFDIFRNGETIGVFQFESPPMQKYLKQLQPTNVGDICFMAAAYRPGPMEYIPDYIKIKNGEKPTNYLIPELEPILKPTLGFPVYQEQLLEICMQFGGFTLGEGDVLRNALKKKQLDLLQAKEKDFKKHFVENFAQYGASVADELWSQLEPFASYGFNKAHAASYAVVAYWCAYIKGNYPLEFMTALMHSDLENTERVVVDMKEARRLGFEILPPDVNFSDIYFQPEGDNGIRFGLGAIKNVGVNVCEKIIKARKEGGEFKHFDDFIFRVGTKNINKRTVECLIKAGAMDSFGERNALLQIIQSVFDKITKSEKAEAIGQTDLFSMMMGDSNEDAKEIDKTPLSSDTTTDKEKLDWERELMGIYVSTHPLAKFAWANILPGMKDTRDFIEARNQSSIRILGSFSEVRELRTKANNDRMAAITIEDMHGTADAVVFPKSFEKFNSLELLTEGRAYIVTGKINVRDDRKSIIIEDIEPANSLMPPKNIEIDISNEFNEENLKKLAEHFVPENEEEGMVADVIVTYGTRQNRKTLQRKARIDLEESIEALKPYIR